MSESSNKKAISARDIAVLDTWRRNESASARSDAITRKIQFLLAIKPFRKMYVAAELKGFRD